MEKRRFSDYRLAIGKLRTQGILVIADGSLARWLKGCIFFGCLWADAKAGEKEKGH